MQQQIINVLVRNYNITPSEAYSWWSAALAEKDERIAQILDNFISASENGLPFLINRNPTINYGSIQQCYCIGWTDTLTMSVSLQSLKPLAADFDGSCFKQYVQHIFNEYIAVVKAIELLETIISYRATI